jgi:catechol 2,3-dioxygenase-like lactoylglutathione lyase family enzyme
MIDHVGFEVSDLARSARFYDAVLYALGARRLVQSEHVVAYGVNAPQVWIVMRGSPPSTPQPPRTPGPGYGHLALQASGKAAVDAAHAGGLANGGSDDGPPGMRPQYGERHYAAYLRDPDGLRVEVVSRR